MMHFETLRCGRIARTSLLGCRGGSQPMTRVREFRGLELFGGDGPGYKGQTLKRHFAQSLNSVGPVANVE